MGVGLWNLVGAAAAANEDEKRVGGSADTAEGCALGPRGLLGVSGVNSACKRWRFGADLVLGSPI